MNAPITISGGGIIGNYISLRLKKSYIKSLIIEKSEDSQALPEGIRTLTLNNHSMAMLKSVGLSIDAADVNKIEVLDGEGTGNIQFFSEDISEESLSHVVLFNDLRNELLGMCREETIFSNEIQSIQNLNKEFKYLENNIIHLSTNVISQNNLNKTKLNRMKLEELLHLSKELNLDIDNLSSLASPSILI